MTTIRIGTAVSERMGISRGYLKVGDMPDGRPMQIPVLIGRGAAPGPTLWLHGCVHGNEACGAFVVHRLFRELDPRVLSGALVALPILNITAFRARQRMSPFEGFAGGDGIPSPIVEAGGKGPAFTAALVAEVVERLRNVMRHLGMLSGRVTEHGPLTYFSNFAWVRAVQGGLFQRAVRCGERLKVGTVLGHYYDLWGQPTGEALSPHAGIVLAINPGPVMTSGETLVHIGLDPREV